jgi:hypothetical protein
VYAPKGSKSINTILRSPIIVFPFLLIFLVALVVFVALSRKAFGLTLQDKVVDLTRQGSQFHRNSALLSTCTVIYLCFSLASLMDNKS